MPYISDTRPTPTHHTGKTFIDPPPSIKPETLSKNDSIYIKGLGHKTDLHRNIIYYVNIPINIAKDHFSDDDNKIIIIANRAETVNRINRLLK